MTYLIASDIHGSALYAGRLVERFAREKADGLILLGDLLYHGPRNDLPEGYAPKKVIEQLNTLREKIVCVRGNCDAEVDQMVLAFDLGREHLPLVLNGRRFFLTHGHHVNRQQPPSREQTQNAAYVVYGHTHVPLKAQAAGVWYLNPGSVSIPKEGSPHAYLLLTDSALLWKDLDGTIFDELPLGPRTEQ